MAVVDLRGQELVRMIDTIHRDKGIDKELIFESIESALYTAARKKLGNADELMLKINRRTGDIEAYEEGRRIDPSEFGRIATQTAKQVIIQRIREAERDVVFSEYEQKVDVLVNGVVQRYERGAIVVNLGRNAEGIVPRSEQVVSDHYRPGDRIRAYVVKVEKKGHRVRIILSRTHPNVVKELFDLEVPEISERIVEIKALVREPGYRTKIAVSTTDTKIDPVGACVGVRGSRIRNIVDELNGEKIDIIRWDSEPDRFIRNSLSPAEITSIELDDEDHRARVVVPIDQLKLAIGKKGQNVRLTARLTKWHIDIISEDLAKELREWERNEILAIPELPSGMPEKLYLAGFKSLRSIINRGPDALIAMMDNVTMPLAEQICDYARTRYDVWINEWQTHLEAREQERRAEREKANSAATPGDDDEPSLFAASSDEEKTGADATIGDSTAATEGAGSDNQQ